MYSNGAMFDSKELVNEQIVIVAGVYLTYPTQKWIKVYHKKLELSKGDFCGDKYQRHG